MAIRGFWGNGSTNDATLFNKVSPYTQGWLIRFGWNDFETSAGVYDHSIYEDVVTDLQAAGITKYILLMNAAPMGLATPVWLTVPPYNVPIVNTDHASGGGQNEFPYYFNTTFKTRKQAALDAIRNRVKDTWSTAWKNGLIGWQSAEGSTGDWGPYKGNIVSVTINEVVQPNPTDYDITDLQWQTYKRTEVWPQFAAALLADIPAAYLMINPDNNGRDWQWGLDNISGVQLKTGKPTHTYQNCGELQVSNRVRSLVSVLPINLVRGECEGTTDTVWFQSQTRQNLFALIAACCHYRITAFQMTLNVVDSVIDVDDPDDYFAFEFANSFLGVRTVSEITEGFLVPRDGISGDDLARFPVSLFGDLIASADQATYTNRYNIILGSSDPQSVKDDRYTSLLVQFFNSARKTALAATMPQATFNNLSTSQEQDAYNQDWGVYMIPDNFSLFITQYSPATTSTGYFRKGTGFIGRFCRSGAEQQYYFDSGLIGSNNYVVTFNIWYLDEGTGTWALYYYNGSAKVSAGLKTNTNTNDWIKYTVTINNLQGGQLLTNACDFTLKTESGIDTKFGLIRGLMVTQNTNEGTAGTYILGNDSGTVCAGSPVTLYTNGPFIITSILYTDSSLTTIQTGFTFVVDLSNNHIYNLDTSTGVVGSDTGSVCTVGTAGTYKTSEDLNNVCNGATVTYYTNGPFAIGKILYTDINLTTALTGITRVAFNNKLYSVNSLTGQVVADIGTCAGGTAGTYKLHNTLLSVCAADPVTLYTDGPFAVTKVLYTDINIVTPQTGYGYVSRVSTGIIYDLNTSTGVVGPPTGSVCGGGLSDSYKIGNDTVAICNTDDVTLYSAAPFGINNILYLDIDMITPLTGYAYIVYNSEIYTVNSSTGQVTGITIYTCSPITVTEDTFSVKVSAQITSDEVTETISPKL